MQHDIDSKRAQPKLLDKVYQQNLLPVIDIITIII